MLEQRDVDRGRKESNPTVLNELLLECVEPRGHAAARPGTVGDTEAREPVLSALDHQRVEEGVRRSVSALYRRAHDAGDRRETNEELEVEPARQVVEVPGTDDLRRHDTSNTLRRLRGQRAV